MALMAVIVIINTFLKLKGKTCYTKYFIIADQILFVGWTCLKTDMLNTENNEERLTSVVTYVMLMQYFLQNTTMLVVVFPSYLSII